MREAVRMLSASQVLMLLLISEAGAHSAAAFCIRAAAKRLIKMGSTEIGSYCCHLELQFI